MQRARALPTGNEKARFQTGLERTCLLTMAFSYYKTVRIALPNTDALSGGGIAGLLIAKNATVFAGLDLLWSGKHGQTAIFDIDAPTKVTIDLGKWANDVTGTVSPGHRYQLVQDMSPHMFATFRLSEVDVIDSGM